MKKILLITLFAACYGSPVLAQKSANAPPPAAATSTVEYTRKDGHTIIVTTNRRFSHVFPYAEDAPKIILLLEEFRSESSRELEGESGSIKVDAWIGKGDKPEKKAWSIKSSANTGEASGEFYKATEYGCCASANVHTWYNLLTGQKVFSGTTNWIKAYVPNSGGDTLDRYLTYHGNDATDPTPEMKKNENVMGVLQYSSKSRNLLRLTLVATEGAAAEMGTPEIGIKHRDETIWATYEEEKEIGIWGSDGKKEKSALSNFSVLLKWEEDKIVEIPFRNDSAILSEAKLLPKMRFELPAKTVTK